MTKAQTKTENDLAEVLKLIMADSPELITDDPMEHRANLIIFGTSVLFQKNENHPGFTNLTPDPPKEED